MYISVIGEKMNDNKDILSFMDLLDLDEEVIDIRLKSIMKRDSHTNKHLTTAIQLLQYKYLINTQENTECENNEECDFVIKLIKQIHSGNAQNVCKITNIVLSLNTSTLVSQSEHLLQQILSNMMSEKCTEADLETAVLNLKLCDSILDAVISNSEKLTLPYLEIPVYSILCSPNQKLKVNFLTTTVPKLFECVLGYNILDVIWNLVKEHTDDNKEIALKVLSSLSEYYLPVMDKKGNLAFESEVIFQSEFWEFILSGIMSADPVMRKLSVYLAKRAIDCLMLKKRNINLVSRNRYIFSWKHEHAEVLKTKWDNFFILLDSLEEKQGNIVMPSLNLFRNLMDIGNCWVNCALNLGLKHDNMQVRLKCIQYRFETKLNSLSEAIVLLEALNDINLYDSSTEYEGLKAQMATSFEESKVFAFVFKAMPVVKWSPVPLYHITEVLANLNINGFLLELSQDETFQLFNDLFRIPCNIILIRKSVHMNLTTFIGLNCRDLHWSVLLSIFPTLDITSILKSPLMEIIKKINLKEDDKTLLFKKSIGNNDYIDFLLSYLDLHPEDINSFIKFCDERIQKIRDIVKRQYSNKKECLNDVIFITNLYIKTNNIDYPQREFINLTISREANIILHYILLLLSNDSILDVEEITSLSKGINHLGHLVEKDMLLQLYKTTLLLLRDKRTELSKTAFSMFIISNLYDNSIMNTFYKHEMVSLKQILEIINNFDSKQNNGRLSNAYYEKSCEFVYELIKGNNSEENLKAIVNYIDHVMECGGYGCLKWILCIINEILPSILNKDIKFDITYFINRMWKEIEEIKSNNQYSVCIEQFISLITHELLLEKPMYNNIILMYCSKIIECSTVKNTPLFYLIKKLNDIKITGSHGHLVCVLCDILLYSPVPRKDQRIAENLIIDILQNSKYNLSALCNEIHFNFQIQLLAVSTLCNICNKEIYMIVTSYIMNKIDDVFKNKQRYHGNSQPHRTLLAALQHLILIVLLHPYSDEVERIKNWCINLLGRLPHQPSVRICLEWYITLFIYIRNTTLNEEVMHYLNSKKVPLTSQFIILYWITSHRIKIGKISNEEFEFSMDQMLSHSMGQIFSIRLHAQYLATKLFKLYKNCSTKYSYTIEIIEKTFRGSCDDKNFLKLKHDYFVNDFDFVNALTPSFIYYFIPKYTDVSNNEKIHIEPVMGFFKNINQSIEKNIVASDFHKEWLSCRKTDDFVFNYNFPKRTDCKIVEDLEAMGTIQKKYIPWKNMSDVDFYGAHKKPESSSELIVVASLIDKLPNLGGLARTSEVFGVRTYVVDSLRHLQDKQFQGLSVSAERWIDVEEVRPGDLKQYLQQKKGEGYVVVAAEQTSTSTQLQCFKFPKKTLLLLGHEKEGVPCELLPLMDFCVEIPQQGVVRSLNVHVTAAIFIWEYSRQHLPLK